jgi:hypothetical protein
VKTKEAAAGRLFFVTALYQQRGWRAYSLTGLSKLNRETEL